MSEKPVILFESYPDFSGSPLEIYNELVKRGYDKKYDLIWAVYNNFNEKTKYKTVKFHNCNSREKQEILKRTKCIIDSNRYILKPRSDCFRLFVRHGVLLKKCDKYCRNVGYADAIITTSDEMRNIDIKTFIPANKNNFIITGLPQTDREFTPANLYDIGFIKELTCSDNRFSKIIGWLPTYRQHRFGGSNSGKYFSFGLPGITKKDDFIKLNDILKISNMLLIVQMHHAQAKNYNDLPKLSNIAFVNEHIKTKYNIITTDLLGNFDALLTDYSAAYYEYILLDRPIGLVINDLVEYSKGTGFVFNYLDWIKGDYLLDITDICNWFKDIANNKDNSKIERNKSLSKIHKFIDNKATQRVVDYLENKRAI